MTLKEWNRLWALVVALWAPRAKAPSVDQLELSLPLLADVPFEAAQRVVQAWSARGEDWPPTAGQIAREYRAADLPALQAGRPTFEEAYRLIYGRGGLLSRSCDPDTIHPLVRSFAVRQGLDRLRVLPVEDPDYGELRRKELREQWDRHVEAMEGRELQVLSLPSAERGQGLRQLDPLSALGAHGPRELEAGDTA